MSRPWNLFHQISLERFGLKGLIWCKVVLFTVLIKPWIFLIKIHWEVIYYILLEVLLVCFRIVMCMFNLMKISILFLNEKISNRPFDAKRRLLQSSQKISSLLFFNNRLVKIVNSACEFRRLLQQSGGDKFNHRWTRLGTHRRSRILWWSGTVVRCG